MADISSTILAIFKADTAPYKRAVKELSGENKKLAKEQLAGLEKQNQGLENQIAKWGKVAGAVGAVIGSYAALQGAAKRFAEQSRLESAAVGKDIASIERAGAGLVTRFQALELAAKTANSQFSATQTEMEEATRFAVLLAERGMGPLEQTLEEVTKAMVEGNVEGLKQFGVQIRAESDTLEGFEALMARIRQENEAAGNAVDGAGTAAEQAGVRWQNALDNLVVQLGRVAEQLAPIVELAAELAERFASIFTGDLSGPSAGEKLADLRKQRSVLSRGGRFNAQNSETIRELEARIRAQEEFIRRNRASNAQRRAAEAEERQRRRVANFTDPGAQFPALPPGFNKNQGGSGGGGRVTVGAPGGSVFLGQQTGFGGFSSGGPIDTGQSSLVGAIQGPEDLTKAAEDAVDQLDPMIAVVGTLQDAFAGLQAAAGQAFADMILGAKGFGESFKEAFGQVLRGLTSQLSGLAISEAVLALAALAKGIGGNPKGFAEAAAHGKAAAAAAAGAVAVGTLARGMGVAAQSAGGGALPAGAAGAGAAGGDGGSSNVTIFVGSDFTPSPRAGAQKLKRQFERGRLAGGDTDTVVFE